MNAQNLVKTLALKGVAAEGMARFRRLPRMGGRKPDAEGRYRIRCRCLRGESGAVDCASEGSAMREVIKRSVELLPEIDPAWSALPLRLIVGYGFFAHGYAKLARGPESFTGILAALGMPFPELLSWATIIVEIVGGLAVLLGLFIPVFAGPMIIVLLVAIFTVHIPNGFSSIKLQAITETGAHFGQPGYETDLLYIAAIIALVIVGSGPWALDRLLLTRFGIARGGKSHV
jgi:putative oxidoreductase